VDYNKPLADSFDGKLALFAVALIGATFSANPILRLLTAIKSKQTVSQFAPEGHQKKQGTPTMGGLIVAFGFLFTYLLEFSLGWQYRRIEVGASGNLGMGYFPGLTAYDIAIPILFFGFAAIGFVDDYLFPRLFAGKRGIGWKEKLLMQLLVALVCSVMMSTWHPLPILFTAFMILFFSNAYNFSDGLVGLASVLLLGFGAFLVILPFGAPVAALLGAILPFFYLNRHPAKVFMGDVGSLPIGAVLGAVVASVAWPRGWLNFKLGGFELDRYGIWMSLASSDAPQEQIGLRSASISTQSAAEE